MHYTAACPFCNIYIYICVITGYYAEKHAFLQRKNLRKKIGYPAIFPLFFLLSGGMFLNGQDVKNTPSYISSSSVASDALASSLNFTCRSRYVRRRLWIYPLDNRLEQRLCREKVAGRRVMGVKILVKIAFDVQR